MEDFESEEEYRSHREKQNKNYRKWRKNTKEALSALRQENPQLKAANVTLKQENTQLEQEKTQLEHENAQIKQENSQLKALLEWIASTLTINTQDRSQIDKREIIGKIAQMLHVASVIDQNIGGIGIDKPPMTPTIAMPMTPMTDSGIEEDSYMQIIEATPVVNTNVDNDSNVMIDNSGSPSTVIARGNEEVSSNSCEQPQHHYDMTSTSNHTNVEENYEDNSWVDDLSDILGGNDLITTINHSELLDLLPGLLQ